MKHNILPLGHGDHKAKELHADANKPCLCILPDPGNSQTVWMTPRVSGGVTLHSAPYLGALSPAGAGNSTPKADIEQGLKRQTIGNKARQQSAIYL